MRPEAKTTKPLTSNLQPDAAWRLAPDTIRLGLFGGTFNPIHFGHLRAAIEIREAFSLKQILFIPTSIPPHKEKCNLLSFPQRLKMLRLAIHEFPFFRASDAEWRRKGKSYSIQTLRYFQRLYRKEVELFFIIGMDAFLEIDTWKDYRELFYLTNFVVMDRPGYRRSHIKNFLLQTISSEFEFIPREGRFRHPGGHSVYLFPITLMAVSSTLIRNFRRQGRAVSCLLPKAVEDYIVSRKFYED